VRLQPRAGADEIVGEREGLLVVRVRAPPERGRANDALCKLIAKRLRIAPGRVELVRGARSRQKLVRVEGVEPTNNHIERLLRPAVLWRKRSFGSQSESGCRWVERLLTVVQTRRLQGRPARDYLYQALVAHRGGAHLPSLISSN